MPIELVFVIGMVVLFTLALKVKANAFISLLATALVLGLLSGMSFSFFSVFHTFLKDMVFFPEFFYFFSRSTKFKFVSTFWYTVNYLLFNSSARQTKEPH